MTADEAWTVALEAMGKSGVFGYSFSKDEQDLLLWCLVCDCHAAQALLHATPMTISTTIRDFEQAHLTSCGDRVEATRDRLHGRHWTGRSHTPKKYEA